MFKIENLDFNTIKEKVQIILKDKKKKQYLFLVLIIIIILILLSNNNEIETQISDIPIENNTEISSENSDILDIYVDISGEVIKPGVYKVRSDTRLFEIIELAGGLTEYADIDSLNQAEIVYDGQKIIVGKYYEQSVESSSNGKTNGKISINNSDSTTLQTLPGIGPSKAQKIIDYRNSNGRFKSIEDIKNVSGIGDATFESIKDLICL